MLLPIQNRFIRAIILNGDLQNNFVTLPLIRGSRHQIRIKIETSPVQLVHFS